MIFVVCLTTYLDLSFKNNYCLFFICPSDGFLAVSDTNFKYYIYSVSFDLYHVDGSSLSDKLGRTIVKSYSFRGFHLKFLDIVCKVLKL